MGFIRDKKYGFKIYLTDEGLRRFYENGLKDSISYFTLGNSESEYRKFTANNNPLKFIIENGDVVDGYYVNPSSQAFPIAISNHRVLELTGENRLDTTITNEMFKSSQNKINSPIFYAPDLSTINIFEFATYKINSEKQYFNLDFGVGGYPIVLGSKNQDLLIHIDDKPNGGYVNAIEPTFQKNILSSEKISFPGVGVANDDFSDTEYQRFVVLNKSKKPITLTNYTLSVNNGVHTISEPKLMETDNKNEYQVEYLIYWNNDQRYLDGRMLIRADKNFLERTKGFILPFEQIVFDVKYEVVNPGDPTKHYHGQTKTNLNRTDGIINFIFNVNGIGDNAEDTVTASIGIVVQTQNNIDVVRKLTRVLCGYAPLNAEDLCDIDTYTLNTVVYVAQDNIASITEAFERKKNLYKSSDLTSQLSNPGYYIDQLSSPTEFVIYKWDGVQLTYAHKRDNLTEIDVYFLPNGTHYGDFSSYQPITIYAVGYTDLDGLYLDSVKDTFTDLCSLNQIQNGYYTMELEKPGSVYEFDGQTTNGWDKLPVNIQSVNVYYSGVDNDPVDKTLYDSTPITIYLNSALSPTLDYTYTNQDLLYSDANCTQLAESGFYVGEEYFEDEEFFIYRFIDNIGVDKRIIYTAPFLLQNVYKSIDPCVLPYTSVSIYSKNDNSETIDEAYVNSTTIYSDEFGTTPAGSGYYITNDDATPSKPFIAYYFNSVTKKWENKIDCLDSATVYYSIDDVRLNYSSVTVYLGKEYPTIELAIQHQIYDDENGLVDVPNGYYSITNPSLNFSYTTYRYIDGVLSEIDKHLVPVKNTVIFYTYEDDGCSANYSQIVELYTYDLTADGDFLSGIKTKHLPLYLDSAGLTQAPSGYYGVPDNWDVGYSFSAPYNWYEYNNVLGQIDLSGYCGGVVAPFGLLVYGGETTSNLDAMTVWTSYHVTSETALFDLIKNNVPIYVNKEGSIGYDGFYFADWVLGGACYSIFNEAFHIYKYDDTTKWELFDICGGAETGQTVSIAAYYNGDVNADPYGSPSGEEYGFYTNEVRLYAASNEGNGTEKTLKQLYDSGMNLYVTANGAYESDINYLAPAGYYKESIGPGTDSWYYWGGSFGWIPNVVVYYTTESSCEATTWEQKTIYFDQSFNYRTLAQILGQPIAIYASPTLQTTFDTGYIINFSEFNEGKPYPVYTVTNGFVVDSVLCQKQVGDTYRVKDFYYKENMVDDLCILPTYNLTPNPIYCELIDRDADPLYERNLQPTIADVAGDTLIDEIVRPIYSDPMLTELAPAGSYYSITYNLYLLWDPLVGWINYGECFEN